MEFSFEVTWIEGQKNILADVFSRNPCERYTKSEYPIRTYLVSSSSLSEMIKSAAKSDIDYKLTLTALKEKKRIIDLQCNHPTCQLRNVRHEISCTDNGLICVSGKRAYIPKSHRGDIINLIHSSHQGIMEIGTINLESIF